jgi:hypothetical protein
MLSPVLGLVYTLLGAYGIVCRFDYLVDHVANFFMSQPFALLFHTASTLLFSRLVPGLPLS